MLRPGGALLKGKIWPLVPLAPWSPCSLAWLRWKISEIFFSRNRASQNESDNYSDWFLEALLKQNLGGGQKTLCLPLVIFIRRLWPPWPPVPPPLSCTPPTNTIPQPVPQIKHNYRQNYRQNNPHNLLPQSFHGGHVPVAPHHFQIHVNSHHITIHTYNVFTPSIFKHKSHLIDTLKTLTHTIRHIKQRS